MRLYGYRNGRTLRALWALEEVGATYEYVEVDVMRGEGREPWFLEINPAGKVPALNDDGTIMKAPLLGGTPTVLASGSGGVVLFQSK